MLGATTPYDLFGTRAPGDRSDLLSLVKAVAKQGVPLLYIKSGRAVVNPKEDAKAPINDPRTSHMKKADDETARQAAKAAGDPRWADRKSRVGKWLATTDTARLTKYLATYIAEYPDEPPNLALLLTGQRLIVVDADQAEDARQFEADFLQATGRHITPTVLTPGVIDADGTPRHKGGGHYYLTLPEGYEVPQGIIEWTPPGRKYVVMLRHQYILVAPSQRAEGPYLQQGGVVEAPQAMLSGIERAAADKERARAERAARRGEGPNAIDEWAAECSWSTLLTRAGYTDTGRQDRCGPDCEIWTAPGDHASPKSATAHDVGCVEYGGEYGHCPLHFWTTSLPSGVAEFVQKAGSTTLTKLQFVAATHHGGNMGAACRALGIASDRPRVDLSHLIDEVSLPEEPPAYEAFSDGVDDASVNEPVGEGPADEGPADEGPADEEPAAPVVELVRTSPTSDNLFDRLDALFDDAFWSSTRGLRAVRRAAEAEGLAPYGLLAAVLPFATASIPPHVRLVKSTGTEGHWAQGASVSLFAGLVGAREIGKTETIAAARALVPLPQHAMEVPDGTHEGIIKSFAETKKVEDKETGDTAYVRCDITDTVMVAIDEVSSLLAEMDRKGSKIATTICSGWVGQRIGTTTGELARRTSLDPHSYRLSIIVGVQQALVERLLRDGNQGVPQRFLFMPVESTGDGTGETCPPLRMPTWPMKRRDGGVALGAAFTSANDLEPVWIHWPSAVTADIAAERAERRRRNRESFDPAHIAEAEDDDETRGHEIVHRLKVTVALAVLDGVTVPDNTHWELAGKVMQGRTLTMEALHRVAEAYREKNLRREGENDGTRRSASRAAEGLATDEAVTSAATRICTLLAGGRAMTRNALRMKMSRRQQAHLSQALGQLVGQGVIETDGNNYRRCARRRTA